MPVDLQVRGAEDFLRLSNALKNAGRTDLRKELNKGLRVATKPLIAATRSEAQSILPQRGGLAARIAKTPQRVQVRTGAATAGVRIVVGKSRSGARGADEGLIRHPVFGRAVFVSQRVPPGWFTATLDRSAPRVRPELIEAIERMARRVTREAR